MCKEQGGSRIRQQLQSIVNVEEEVSLYVDTVSCLFTQIKTFVV